MDCGIYEIVNSKNGKRYVGSAVSFRARSKAHLFQLNRGTHHSRHLQSAWTKHGPDAFDFKILLYCDRACLLVFEQIAMNALLPQYNICQLAGSALGTKRTEEQKMVLRVAIKASGRPNDHMRGRKHSSETIAKMSEAQRGNTSTKGKKRTPEAIAKTAAAHRGMKRSPETCAKIAAKALGRIRSPESVEKGAAKRRGVPLSPVHRARLLGNKYAAGKKPTPETTAHRSEALKAAWAAKRAAGKPWRPPRSLVQTTT